PCGGVHTDLAGRTDVAGLHAIGETAYTGLHGANRLASNSLVECMVIARSAVIDILATPLPLPLPPQLPAWDESQVTDADESVVISHNWDELRRFMWDYVGIVRTNKRLERAAHRITLLKSAQSRHESRGLHFSRDYPQAIEDTRPTTLVPAR